MHPMPFGGFVIDTPGIKGFGVVDMERNEIYHFFREIFKISKDAGLIIVFILMNPVVQ